MYSSNATLYELFLDEEIPEYAWRTPPHFHPPPSSQHHTGAAALTSSHAPRDVPPQSPFAVNTALGCACVCSSHSSSYQKTFFDVSTFQEVFDYLEGPFYQGLYPNKFYNNQSFDGTWRWERGRCGSVDGVGGVQGAVTGAFARCTHPPRVPPRAPLTDVPRTLVGEGSACGGGWCVLFLHPAPLPLSQSNWICSGVLPPGGRRPNPTAARHERQLQGATVRKVQARCREPRDRRAREPPAVRHEGACLCLPTRPR